MLISTFRTRDIYKAKADLTHSEIKLNTCVIWPAMKASINAIDTNHHLHFYPGEERLISMERQLKAAGHDEQVCYKADGIIKAMLERSELEILILETSNALDATTPTKRAFDFHKAMFGAVAMLKSIADRYKYADFSVFSALKIYFLHVAGKLMRYS